MMPARGSDHLPVYCQLTFRHKLEDIPVPVAMAGGCHCF
jgi:hypothetical protein